MQAENFQQFAAYQWLVENPDWLGVAMFLTAFLESLAIVGVVVPGVLILSAIAFLAGSGLLDLQSALLLAFAGAVLGDGSSFLLGRAFQDKARDWPLLRRHAQWISYGEKFFDRYGILGIIIGRFLGPIRPVIPLVAGMLKMPPPVFFSVNIFSGLAWAPAYILPGYALGASMDMGYSTAELALMSVAGLIVIAACFYGFRRTFLTP